MSAALPVPPTDCCPIPCDDVLVQNIPGPEGDPGTNGTNGADGISAITSLIIAFTMPAELASGNANALSTAGLVVGENVFVQSLGTLQVTAILTGTTVTLKNLEDAATSAYTGNAAPGTIAAIGSRVGPTGLQGPSGLLSGAAAGGDLKGTYPNPKLALPNTLGALVAGNGTDATALAAGTNGQIPAYDSTQPLGILPKSIIPVTGATNAAADQLVRLSSATGTPIALSVSKASIKDPGGAGVVVADATAGNARGTNAIDLQVDRGVVGATGVASGARAVIAGGRDNIASAAQGVVVGGNNNANSGSESFIGGGTDNTIESAQSVVGGGDTNRITSGTTIESFIGGGKTNKIQSGATQAVVAGGSTNQVSSVFGSILGGAANIVTGRAASIIGGTNATADKHGQRAFSSGAFADQADCQHTELIWRCSTIGIVGATEMFLDGAIATQRATIPADTTWAFEILVTARSSAGLNAAWTIKGVINNLGGTTSIATAVVNALIADNTGATFGTLANVPVASADNPNDALVIHVANPAATNVRWAAIARIMEIHY